MFGRAIGLLLLLSAHLSNAGEQTFRVATYNLESYLDQPSSRRKAKPPEAKAKVCENILAIKPDVIAMEEMGTTNALMELQSSVKNGGVNLPFWEHITGHDTNIHLAILSKFPITSRRPHTNDAFLLGSHRHFVSRGFAEVEIEITPKYRFTLIAAHLKSRLAVGNADEAEERLQEAMQLRELVDMRLTANPELNLIVVGDFNDIRDSAPLKAIVGNGLNPLFDLRPAERPHPPHIPSDEHGVTWTYHFSKQDVFSRIDYILVSRGMSREWLNEDTYVFSSPDWGLASDHRPLVADFIAVDK
ncbi:MAG: endonuclease/exonuclease/phosphatase family protein [Limisphaerales bacterium]